VNLIFGGVEFRAFLNLHNEHGHRVDALVLSLLLLRLARTGTAGQERRADEK
jgi:hypothetical protein